MSNQVTYSRLCPSCGTEKFYPNQNRLNIALKKNSPCKSCRMKHLYAENPGRNRGKNNPMFGRGCVGVWRDTLPADQFDQKMAEYKSLRSRQNSGCDNPMFGKPSPKASGHGISGVWNGCHFRSLLELQFLEWHYEKFNCMPLNAETSQYRIILPSGKYYYPDFVSANGFIVEVKPKRLLKMNAEKIQAGKNAHGDKFVVMTEDCFKPQVERRIHLFRGIRLNARKRKSAGFEKLLVSIA